MSDRHNTYFELRDAIAAPGCVVCRLAARSVRRYLEALSFESVNDHGLRGQLRRARGFCNLHAWQLLDEVRDPFGAGIVYRDVLNECRRLLERGAVADLVAGGACLACAARGGAAARYLDVLVEHLAGELGAPLARAGGLCWAHFGTGVARAGRGLSALALAQREAIDAVGAGAVGGRVLASQPAPGVRAGSAAPRRSPGERASDPLVAMAVGLPGVQGPSIDNLEARGWGESAADTTDRGAQLGHAGPAAREVRPAAPTEARSATPGRDGRPLDADPAVPRPSLPGPDGRSVPVDAAGAAAGRECPSCLAARAAVERAAELLSVGPVGPTELCGPHAWLALDVAGAAAIGARLRPGLELLAERIDAAGPALARAAPLSLGPISLTLPAARRARGDLALQLAPGRGCVVCQAQLAAEEAALLDKARDRPLCRPHLLVAAGAGVRVEPGPTLAHWRAIVDELDEYIRKSDYRFRGEPRGSEQHSPWRAIAAVAAARGLR